MDARGLGNSATFLCQLYGGSKICMILPITQVPCWGKWGGYVDQTGTRGDLRLKNDEITCSDLLLCVRK